MKAPPAEGQVFGELTMIRVVPERGRENRVMALWACSCGKEKALPISRVRAGLVRSCGHLTKENKPALTHGMRSTKEYRTWQGAKARCNNPSNKDFPRYGGAGIRFYEGWTSDFQAFYAHIGPCPSPRHQIDRIDSKRGYEPGNVRWATVGVQARNRRQTYEWSIKGLHFGSITEAASHYQVSVHTVWRWTHGFTDKRRSRFTPKLEDCHAIPRY